MYFIDIIVRVAKVFLIFYCFLQAVTVTCLVFELYLKVQEFLFLHSSEILPTQRGKQKILQSRTSFGPYF